METQQKKARRQNDFLLLQYTHNVREKNEMPLETDEIAQTVSRCGSPTVSAAGIRKKKSTDLVRDHTILLLLYCFTSASSPIMIHVIQ